MDKTKVKIRSTAGALMEVELNLAMYAEAQEQGIQRPQHLTRVYGEETDRRVRLRAVPGYAEQRPAARLRPQHWPARSDHEGSSADRRTDGCHHRYRR